MQTFLSECVQDLENSGVNSMASFVGHTEIDSCSMIEPPCDKLSQFLFKSVLGSSVWCC